MSRSTYRSHGSEHSYDSRSGKSLRIQELDLDMISPNDRNVNTPKQGFKLVVIGKPKSGKSNLIRAIMYYKKHLIPAAMVMCSTEDVNGDFGRILPDTFLFNEYSESKLEELITRQKIALNHLANPWSMVLLDDCTDDPAVFPQTPAT